jgi:uncharacterized membrane protein YfcA
LFAAEAEEGWYNLSLGPIEFFFVFLVICIFIGILAVLGGVGGGVIFTPLMLGFTPIDSFIIRATGLLVAMAGSLTAARPFLSRGLANIRLIFFISVPYTIVAIIGALLAGYVKQSAGETGEAILRLALGVIVASVSAMLLFWGKRVEYPDVKKSDRFTEQLSLSMSYYEASLGKIVDYKLKRAPIGVLIVCFVGLISGLFGLGAGWAMVPAFNMVMLAPIKVAAASSKVLIGIGDTAAIWPYLTGGGIFPLFAAPCVIGVVLGTYIGAKIMLKIKAGFIRYLIIGVLFFSGAKLIVDGIQRLT